VGIVAPDSRHVDTFALNPEHKHVTTPDVLKNWMSEAGRYRIMKEELPNQGWSCGLIAQAL
jgi:hypothetical protein